MPRIGLPSCALYSIFCQLCIGFSLELNNSGVNTITGPPIAQVGGGDPL